MGLDDRNLGKYMGLIRFQLKVTNKTYCLRVKDPKASENAEDFA